MNPFTSICVVKDSHTIVVAKYFAKITHLFLQCSIHLELIYILHCFGAQKALSDDFGKLASYLTCSGFYSPSVFIAMTCIVFIQHCKRNPSQGGLAVMPGVMCAQAFSFQFPFPLLDALFFKADSFTLPLILSQFMYTCVCSSEWLHVHSLGQPHC